MASADSILVFLHYRDLFLGIIGSLKQQRFVVAVQQVKKG
jgi:hypothetical protein